MVVVALAARAAETAVRVEGVVTEAAMAAMAVAAAAMQGRRRG